LPLPRDVPGRKDRKVKSRRESILLKYKYEKVLKILSSSMTSLSTRKCETVGNPLAAVALYGIHVLGLSQVAWPTVLP